MWRSISLHYYYYKKEGTATGTPQEDVEEEMEHTSNTGKRPRNAIE